MKIRGRGEAEQSSTDGGLGEPIEWRRPLARLSGTLNKRFKLTATCGNDEKGNPLNLRCIVRFSSRHSLDGISTNSHCSPNVKCEHTTMHLAWAS